MTYLNSKDQNPSPLTSTPVQTHAAYIAGVSPVVQAVIAKLLLWLAGATSGNRNRVFGSGKAGAVISALVMIMICLPGSFAQKKALLQSHIDKVAATCAKLYAAYLVWRQRKCWMWGGGFMSGALTGLCDVFAGARDQKSFDALIPN